MLSLVLTVLCCVVVCCVIGWYWARSCQQSAEAVHARRKRFMTHAAASAPFKPEAFPGQHPNGSYRVLAVSADVHGSLREVLKLHAENEEREEYKAKVERRRRALTAMISAGAGGSAFFDPSNIPSATVEQDSADGGTDGDDENDTLLSDTSAKSLSDDVPADVEAQPTKLSPEYMVPPDHALQAKGQQISKEHPLWCNEHVHGRMGERLEKAKAKTGSRVTVSLMWDNQDDLDLHVQTPCTSHIFWKKKKGNQDGHLDVDMNAEMHKITDEPVENIYFDKPAAGHYRVWVENNHRRARRGENTVMETPYTVRLTIDNETTEKVFQDIDEYEEVVAFEFDINPVQLELYMAGKVDMASIEADESKKKAFVEKFKSDVARAASVQPSRVVFDGMRPSDSVVEFHISEPMATQLSASIEEPSSAQAVASLEAAVKAEIVVCDCKLQRDALQTLGQRGHSITA